MNTLIEEAENTVQQPIHYYGDNVRRCFVLGALVMLCTLPYFIHRLPISLYGAILLIVIIVTFAGATNPRQLWSACIDGVVSVCAFCVFTYYAVTTYIQFSWKDLYVWVNEALAIIFFVAFYFAVKTVRGFLVEKQKA